MVVITKMVVSLAGEIKETETQEINAKVIQERLSNNEVQTKQKEVL